MSRGKGKTMNLNEFLGGQASYSGGSATSDIRSQLPSAPGQNGGRFSGNRYSDRTGNSNWRVRSAPVGGGGGGFGGNRYNYADRPVGGRFGPGNQNSQYSQRDDTQQNSAADESSNWRTSGRSQERRSSNNSNFQRGGNRYTNNDGGGRNNDSTSEADQQSSWRSTKTRRSAQTDSYANNGNRFSNNRFPGATTQNRYDTAPDRQNFGVGRTNRPSGDVRNQGGNNRFGFNVRARQGQAVPGETSQDSAPSRGQGMFGAPSSSQRKSPWTGGGSSQSAGGEPPKEKKKGRFSKRRSGKGFGADIVNTDATTTTEPDTRFGRPNPRFSRTQSAPVGRPSGVFGSRSLNSTSSQDARDQPRENAQEFPGLPQSSGLNRKLQNPITDIKERRLNEARERRRKKQEEEQRKEEQREEEQRKEARLKENQDTFEAAIESGDAIDVEPLSVGLDTLDLSANDNKDKLLDCLRCSFYTKRLSLEDLVSVLNEKCEQDTAALLIRLFQLLDENKTNDINVVTQLLDESSVNLLSKMGAPGENPIPFLQKHKLEYLTPTADVDDEVRAAIDNEKSGLSEVLAIVEREAAKGLKLSQTLSKFILESLFSEFYYSEDRDLKAFVGHDNFAKLVGFICPIDNKPLQMEFINTIVLRWYDWTQDTKPSSSVKGIIKEVFDSLYRSELVQDQTFVDWKDEDHTSDEMGAAKRASLMKTCMWFDEIDPANRMVEEDDDEFYSDDEQINNEYLGGDALQQRIENNNDYGNDDPNDFGFSNF